MEINSLSSFYTSSRYVPKVENMTKQLYCCAETREYSGGVQAHEYPVGINGAFRVRKEMCSEDREFAENHCHE